MNVVAQRLTMNRDINAHGSLKTTHEPRGEGSRVLEYKQLREYVIEQRITLNCFGPQQRHDVYSGKIYSSPSHSSEHRL